MARPVRSYRPAGWERYLVPRRLRICVITSTRADYGLLKHLMRAIFERHEFELQIVASGTHLSVTHGYTTTEIESDGFHIDRRVDLNLTDDSAKGIARSTALGITGFCDVFADLTPDLVLILGDRYEILSAAIAALFSKIPVAHIHGGELTEGAMDDAVRHSITKLSHLHFVATETYRARVIQLGENPKRVFNVGGLGVDAIAQLKLLNRTQLEQSLCVKFWKKNLLVTFHPATLERDSSIHQIQELLNALSTLKETLLIFTMPNADSDSRIIMDLIREFTSMHSNAHAFDSLGQLRYLSCLAQVDGVVGNSSSGILEAPSLGTPTVNIGDRQKGRVMASSIICCTPRESEIRAAIAKLYDPTFRSRLDHVDIPYGQGGAVNKIIKVLAAISVDNLIIKKFYDLQSDKN